MGYPDVGLSRGKYLASAISLVHVLTLFSYFCRNLVVEEEVPIESLVDGEECWISNGARGFQEPKAMQVHRNVAVDHDRFKLV